MSELRRQNQAKRLAQEVTTSRVPEFLRPNHGWFLGAAGLVAAYIIERLEAPLWLAVLTFFVLLVAAALWPWIERQRNRKLGFWSLLCAYALFATVCVSATGAKSKTPTSPSGGAKEIEQKDVYAKLTVQPFMPTSRNVLRTGITVTNGGGTDISDHRIGCFLRRVTYSPHGGISNLTMSTTLPGKFSLRAYGDGETSYCIAGIQSFPPDSHAVCADITVIVSYRLATQPDSQQKKELRFVADGEDFFFRQQLVDYSGDYCPAPS